MAGEVATFSAEGEAVGVGCCLFVGPAGEALRSASDPKLVRLGADFNLKGHKNSKYSNNTDC